MATFCRSTLYYAGPLADGATPTAVDIRDGRAAALPGWAEAGFELVPHGSAITDWDDAAAVAAVHYAEMEALAQQLTGCDAAVVADHIARNPEQAARHRDLGPIDFVHSDFAAGHDAIIRRNYREAASDGRGAAALARHALTPDLVDAARRLVILQFWRNVGPARMDMPLALCDARTVRPDDARPFVVADYAGAGGGAFEALAVMAPAEPGRHRWYAFPDLQRDEVIAFRTYDTDRVAAGVTFFTPHTAFRDPDVELGAPARRSIELRATCLFG